MDAFIIELLPSSNARILALDLGKVYAAKRASIERMM